MLYKITSRQQDKKTACTLYLRNSKVIKLTQIKTISLLVRMFLVKVLQHLIRSLTFKRNLWCKVAVTDLENDISFFCNILNQTVKIWTTTLIHRSGFWFFSHVSLYLTELACSQMSRSISERSDHCLFRVEISVCSCRRSVLSVGPRPERPHLEVLLRGQRSMLLNLSDNIYT